MQDFLYEALIEQDTLCHHGILGQKWGVRRYQNKDGSLTDAGKKRYNYAANKKDIYIFRREQNSIGFL